MKPTDKWISAHREEILTALCESIRIPSVKASAEPGAPFGREIRRALDHILAIAQRYGLKTTDEDGYIGYADVEGGKEMLGILAHLDVVDVSDHWAHTPFVPQIEDGRLYGRGTLDDKGPAIGTLYALIAVRACGYRFRRSVRMFFGCDEESGFGCINHYLEHGRMPDLSFSPDSEYPLVNSEKSICQIHAKKPFSSAITAQAGTVINAVPDNAWAILPFPASTVKKAIGEIECRDGISFSLSPEGDGTRMTVKGRAAHAASPQKGANALLAMVAVLANLPLEGEDRQIVHQLFRLFGQECYGERCGLAMEDSSGRLTINVSLLHWDAQGISDLGIDCRCPPAKDAEQVVRRLSALLEEAGLELVSTHAEAGHYVDPQGELPSTLLDVYAARFGERPAPLSVGGGTYARCLDNAVGFGYMRPGIAYHTHMDDEMIILEHYMEDICLMADAIIALACEPMEETGTEA